MAAKKPAAPPPTTMTRRELIRANLTGHNVKVSHQDNPHAVANSL
jgi:RNase P/RNase MRP subunit p29